MSSPLAPTRSLSPQIARLRAPVAWLVGLSVWLAGAGLGLHSATAATPRPTARRPLAPGAQPKVRVRDTTTSKVKTTQGTAVATTQTRDAVAGRINEAQKRCEGATIEHVQLTGCAGTRCKTERAQRRFLRLADLVVGEPVLAKALPHARRRLEITRFFRVTNITCERKGDRARVTVALVGNNLIRRVRFLGNQALFTAELRNKVQLQPGDVLNPATEETKHTLEQQRRSVRSAYAREGFDDVKVTLEVKALGEGLVELEVRIEEGERKRVVLRTLRVVDHHKPSDQERAAGLICRRVSERALLRVSGLNDVDVFTRRAGVRGRARIRERLRQLGYGNPRVSVNHVEADQHVKVRVQLGRCNIIHIFERETNTRRRGAGGWRMTDEADYTAVLPFTQSGVFDMEEADRGRRALGALLENRGYFFSDVSLEVRDVPPAWASRVRRAIVYRITTGYQAQIRGLQFPGAKHFTREQLLENLVTRSYDFFDDGGYLQTAQLLGDLEQLRQQYRNAGFFEFRYKMELQSGSTDRLLRNRRKPSPSEDIIDVLTPDRGFRVRRPINEHFIYIDVPVWEGRQTRLDALTVHGPGPEGERRLRDLLGLKSGQVLSFSRMAKGLKKVESWYQDHGYFQAKVEVLCRVRGASAESLTARVTIPVDPCKRPVPPAGAKCPKQGTVTLQCQDQQDAKEKKKADVISVRQCQPNDWCRCTQQRILGESVDMRLQVHEGPRVRIGEVFVSGNFNTKSALLTDNMPSYGRLYSGQALFESLRKVRNLGIFRSVSIEQIGVKECPPRQHIALVLRVVENNNTTIDLDAGFQTANVKRTDSNNTIGQPPGLLVDALEHLVSAGARLNAGTGQRVGATLPRLVLTSSADYRNRNFRGLGQELRAVARIGISSNIADLAKQPFSLGLAAISWTNSHLPYGVSLKVIPFVSRDYVTTLVDVDKIAMATEVSKRLYEHVAVSLGAEGGVVSYRKEPGEPMTGFNPQLKIIPRATWDRLNSPINPTRGFYATSSLAYINAIIEDATTLKANRGNFLKLEGQLKWFGTLRNTFTLGLMIRGGAAMQLGTDTDASAAGLPSNETFRLGGQLGLRGVSDNGVLQYERNGEPQALLATSGDPAVTQVVCAEVDDTPPCTRGGIKTYDDGAMLLAGTVEGRFPLIRRAGLWGAVFWDWGAIADDFNGFSYAAAFRHGVGVGLRFLISGQIPLRIDYGIAVDRRCRQPFTVVGGSSCPEQEEFGQLQAGLLYAF